MLLVGRGAFPRMPPRLGPVACELDEEDEGLYPEFEPKEMELFRSPNAVDLEEAIGLADIALSRLLYAGDIGPADLALLFFFGDLSSNRSPSSSSDESERYVVLDDMGGRVLVDVGRKIG